MHMGCSDHVRDAIGDERCEQRDGFFKILRPIVNAGQHMGVDLNHALLPAYLPIWPRTRPRQTL